MRVRCVAPCVRFFLLLLSLDTSLTFAANAKVKPFRLSGQSCYEALQTILYQLAMKDDPRPFLVLADGSKVALA